MSVHSVSQVVQFVKLFAGNNINNGRKELVFVDFVGLCSGKKCKKIGTNRRRIGRGVNSSNIQLFGKCSAEKEDCNHIPTKHNIDKDNSSFSFREGYYRWEDHRMPGAAFKGTSGGWAISIGACDDHQNSGDTTAFTGALTYSFANIGTRTKINLWESTYFPTQ